MYIRFTVHEISEESGQKLGIFHAIRYLYDDGELTDLEFDLADRLMAWFSKNLGSPLRYLNKQKSKKSVIYISWFKVSSKSHIEKARELASILENKDISVEVLKTNKPGKIVFEDEHQIFARPYKKF